MTHYVLDCHGKPIPEEDYSKWIDFFTKENRKWLTRGMVGPFVVRTTFLGVMSDHDGPEGLFLTHVKHPEKHDDWTLWAMTRNEAAANHTGAVAQLEALIERRGLTSKAA